MAETKKATWRNLKTEDTFEYTEDNFGAVEYRRVGTAEWKPMPAKKFHDMFATIQPAPAESNLGEQAKQGGLF